MKITHYKLSLLFTRCTVLMPLPNSFATSRMEYPLWSKLITSLYSSFVCSVVFTEPTFRPSFPPFSIYRFRPDCNRNEILSRSNCAQVESLAIIILLWLATNRLKILDNVFDTVTKCLHRGFRYGYRH